MNKNNSRLPRTLTGTVISNKMRNTIIVLVERRVKHPKYHKFIKRSTKIHVHNSKDAVHVGDIVVAKECRPLSKTKSWTLLEIKEKSDETI